MLPEIDADQPACGEGHRRHRRTAGRHRSEGRHGALPVRIRDRTVLGRAVQAGSRARRLAPGFGEDAVTQEIAGLRPGDQVLRPGDSRILLRRRRSTKTGTVVSQEHTFTTRPRPTHPNFPIAAFGNTSRPAEGRGRRRARARGRGHDPIGRERDRAHVPGHRAHVKQRTRRQPRPRTVPDLRHRGPSGWSCTDISPPNTEGVGPLANEKRGIPLLLQRTVTSLVDPIDRVRCRRRQRRERLSPS